MTRRSSHRLVEHMTLPWWVSFIVAGLVFSALRWGLPYLASSSPLLTPLASRIAELAVWFATIFLLPIPLTLFNQRRRSGLTAGQASIDGIRALSWQEFERLVGESYRRQGYRVRARSGGGADGGIDLTLHDGKGKAIVVQCKRWKTRTVGVELVRELYGVMVGEEAHAAIFVTSGRYTPDALAFARDKPIKLIDGAELVEMIRTVQATHLQPARSLATSQVDDSVAASAPPNCPRCSGEMVRRVARRGASRGDEFWGCSDYPSCRGTRPI